MYKRHLSCRLLPDMAAIRDFDLMTTRYFSQLCKKLEESLIHDPSWDPVQALKDKADFTRTKKITYYTQLL